MPFTFLPGPNCKQSFSNLKTSKEKAMTNQTRPYEPLTSQNVALVLVDHQVGFMTGVPDYSTGELKHNVVALAKAAKALKLPIIVTTTARDSMWGPTFPELVEALPGIEIIDRSSVNAFDDARVPLDDLHQAGAGSALAAGSRSGADPWNCGVPLEP
jgi:hypothetical protein